MGSDCCPRIMGVLGLTHDENGAALEKLPVTIKVAVGEGPGAQ